MYRNNVDIEISPEDDVVFNYEDNDIPSSVTVLYCDLTDVINLFNSPRGYRVLKKAMVGEVKMHIIPTDSVVITENEREFLMGHQTMFDDINIHLYQTWYDSNLNFNIHLGATIHTALKGFLKKFETFSFNTSEKKTTFLSLNNLPTPNRIELYDYYENLTQVLKNKFKCSFRFNDIEIDDSLTEDMSQYDEIYTRSGFEHYRDCLIEIVSESSGEAVTEKTYKALAAGVPIINWMSEANGIQYSIEFLKLIGIDSIYFGIDYKNPNSVKSKIDELLQMEVSEILEKYDEDFKKAEKNKQVFYQFVKNMETKTNIS